MSYILKEFNFFPIEDSSEILNNTFLNRDSSAKSPLEKHISLESQRGHILQDTATFLQTQKKSRWELSKDISSLSTCNYLIRTQFLPLLLMKGILLGCLQVCFCHYYFLKIFFQLSFLTMIFVLVKFGFDFPTSSVTSWPVPRATQYLHFFAL